MMGSIPVLCIIQARWNSMRLPGKMLLKLGNETLIERAWRIAESCNQELYEWVSVVAIPKSDESSPLGDELRRIGARIFAWDGPEWDVLGRFYHCAHHYRWHPDTVIVRYTPDDPFKTAGALRAAARGFRLPVEQGGEAFTLAQLDEAQRAQDYWNWGTDITGHRIYEDGKNPRREHITDALFPFRLPTQAGLTIDTQEDYEAAVKLYEQQAAA